MNNVPLSILIFVMSIPQRSEGIALYHNVWNETANALF